VQGKKSSLTPGSHPPEAFAPANRVKSGYVSYTTNTTAVLFAKTLVRPEFVSGVQNRAESRRNLDSVLVLRISVAEEAAMPDKKYTKVEEEIIQILDRMGDDPAPPRQPNLRLVHSKKPRRSVPTLPRVPRISPTIILAGVFLFAFIALMTSGIVQIVAAALAIICFVAMLLGRGKSSRSGSTPNFGPQTWRGRDITLSPDHSTPIGDRISGWLRRIRR